MMFYPNERIALFIDGQALYFAAKANDFEIDWKKVYELFEKKGILVRAFYYSMTWREADDENPNAPDFTPLRPLLDYLSYNGFIVTEKQTQEFTNDRGDAKRRGSILPDMIVDIMELAPHVQHIVIFSGNSDLRRTVEYCQKQGKRVTIVSSLQGGSCADSLRRQADGFVDVKSLRSAIERVSQMKE